MKKWSKMIWKTLSYVLVACIASVLTLALALGGADGGIMKLRQIDRLIESVFINEVDTTALYDAAAEGMVSGTGDRWSYYISASEMDTYNRQKDNVYTGVGITIRQREDDKGFDILQVEPKGSAYEQGILPGDILYAVEGEPVSQLGIQETGNRIGGKEGTQVTVTVLRQEQELTFTLQRKKIQVAVATGQLLEGNVGYIRIVNFNAGCAEQTIACMEDLMTRGAEKLVFDVRYNGGGYVTQMVELLDYILPAGDLFISENYKGERKVETSGESCVEMPMVVLVNESSYSAAEFFAAALREYQWATVVGLPTSGKGYFQTTYTLADGSAVALSIGRYYTPKGVSLAEEGGLIPDVTVVVDEETAAAIYSQTIDPADDPQLQAAIKTLQSF